MTVAVAGIIDELRPVRRPARVLYWGAGAWLLSGVIHVFALAADDWTWSGAISFRKPISFSVSIGLLLATIGWVLDRLPERPRLAGALAWTLLLSSTGEVGLITLQAWRGRASHFNTIEAGDALIFSAMGVLVGVMSLCLLTVFVWSIVRRAADPLVRLAVIAGLALVITGLGIGQWLIELGNDYVAAHGVVPETVTYGDAGVAKFPHAVAFHGVQAFIVAAVMLRHGSHDLSTARRLLRVIVLAYSASLVFASVQTITGRGPFDLGVWGLGMVAAVAVLVSAFTQVVLGLRATADENGKAPLAVA